MLKSTPLWSLPQQCCSLSLFISKSINSDCIRIFHLFAFSRIKHVLVLFAGYFLYELMNWTASVCFDNNPKNLSGAMRRWSGDKVLGFMQVFSFSVYDKSFGSKKGIKVCEVRKHKLKLQHKAAISFIYVTSGHPWNPPKILFISRTVFLQPMPL